MITIMIAAKISIAAVIDSAAIGVLLFFASDLKSDANCPGILDKIFAISRIDTPFPIDFSSRICASHIIIPVPAVINVVIKITHATPFQLIKPPLLKPIAIQQL